MTLRSTFLATLAVSAAVISYSGAAVAQDADKPNILVIWGDDIGQSNISAYTMGLMGYETPNIDRIADEGMIFTDYYGEQSCTAGRSSFIMGQSVFRTGLSKVGLPGAEEGMQIEDPTIAGLLKGEGYATGQFGKNHLGDRDEHLPTNHGFDEFFGNLYHLNAEEEPENEDYPGDMVLADGSTFRETFGPRGVVAVVGRRRDRGYRAADAPAHGDGGRGDGGRRPRLHRAQDRGGRALVRLVVGHPDALPHPCEARRCASAPTRSPVVMWTSTPPA